MLENLAKKSFYPGDVRLRAMIDLVRQEIATFSQTIVVKLGSRVLTTEDNRLDYQRIEQLASELNKVFDTGRRVVVVSSGAVTAGLGRLGLRERPTDLAQLQAIAAIGQSALVEAYEKALAKHRRHAAQILLTAEDVEDRTRYLNARNTILALLELGAVPIINENDTISVDELRLTFGDNDRLAAIVTNLIQAPLLVLLSDVEGLYTGHPSDPGSKLIPLVERFSNALFGYVRDKKTGHSRGGMASKLEAARIVTSAGGNVIIAPGRQPGVLEKIIAGEPVGTLFLASSQVMAARKRWIGLTVKPRGAVIVDDGAKDAIERNGKSLLPIGIVKVSGSFKKGDVIAVRDLRGKEIARGLTNYSADDIRRIRGLKTSEITEALGHCPYEEVIHRDNMAVFSAE